MVKSFSIAKKPRVLFGVGLTTEAPKELKKAGCKNIFVLSDPVLKKMGAFQPLYDALDSEGLDYSAIFVIIKIDMELFFSHSRFLHSLNFALITETSASTSE